MLGDHWYSEILLINFQTTSHMPTFKGYVCAYSESGGLGHCKIGNGVERKVPSVCMGLGGGVGYISVLDLPQH